MTAVEHQRLAYRDKFRSLSAEVFQSWFEELAHALHPVGEFQAIRKTQGDGGLDGLVINSQMVYAVYAPARRQEDRDSATAAKIHSDFTKAYSSLQGKLKAWVFVHNHPEGKLGKKGANAINDLKSKHFSVEITVLNIDSLWEKLKILPAETLSRFFGEKGDGAGPSPWEVSFERGSSYRLLSGVAGTLNSPNGHHLECFSSDATVILGTLDGALMKKITSNRASWQIHVRPKFFNDYARGFVVIGCLRYYGGLHSRRYNSVAKISMNGRPLDRILLRIKPEDHSDYFCQIPKPELLPIAAPFTECRTLYAWSLIRENLVDSSNQSLEVEIDKYANWDIDCVGVIFQRSSWV